jgi:hypothetical protein
MMREEVESETYVQWLRQAVLTYSSTIPCLATGSQQRLVSQRSCTLRICWLIDHEAARTWPG